MVNKLAAMHNLKGKQIDFTQALPQAKLKEDIYLRKQINRRWVKACQPCFEMEASQKIKVI
jgi:hypothetical protein